MISLVILLFLALGTMTGVRRGAVLQIGHLLSLIISFIVALSFYDELAEKFKLWIPYPSTLDDAGIDLTMFSIPSSVGLDEVFYKAFWFIVLFFVTKIVLSIIIAMFDSLTNIPVLKQVKGLLGGVFGFIEMYIFIFLILFLAAFAPVQSIQDAIANSSLASFMIQHTPVLADWLMQKVGLIK
ncbi:CvpA family protein [Exiguobacterium sp. Helios]|uniref:CvpA family protein n=1 Tax=unclassified Exiguobacterium TaxID=2644629 RepID=UPI000DF763AB|nr:MULTISPECIES: CvpA family protein [unclassified Exiguobacterium]QNR21752.1 CvpA family protein [Exiguobacterium sp. Helios]RDB33497.1 CvpA family protein [Exiguobacterium sp. RIT594]